MTNTLISIAGPTGVGKTALSIALAQYYNTEIISVDSKQFYRQMNIGTAKASESERTGIPHHFIDFLDPNESYNVGQFEQAARQKLSELFQKHKVVIAVGGSTLYFNSLWNSIDPMPEVDPEVRLALNQLFQTEGIVPLQQELQTVDPTTWETVDQKNPIRLIRALEIYRSSGNPISFYRQQTQKENPWNDLKIILDTDRDTLYYRLDSRVDTMIEAGLLAEVQQLLTQYDASLSSMQAIGYQELCQHLAGNTDLTTAIDAIKQHSRNYAKRQLTYFRREQNCHWLTDLTTSQAFDKVLELNKPVAASNDPLHGITLAVILQKLIDHYGYEELGQHINVNCFQNNPSYKSSLGFFRKTPWARTKLEEIYLGTRFK
jgi:tRNA dimethylallyltransferase